MNTNVVSRMLVVGSILVLASFSGCSGPLDKGKSALRADLFKTIQRYDAPSGDKSVFLIGENHASVKGQVQLAELLEGLYHRDSIEAILIEGSNGPIDVSAPGGYGEDNQRAKQHWKDELEWGRLAAYEYVALTQPGTVVFGIEDLAAQARFAASSEGKDLIKSTEWELQSSQRAVSLFNQAVAELGNADPEVDSEITKYKQLVNREQYLQSRLLLGGRAQELVSKLADARRQMAKLAEGLRPFESLIAQLQKSVRAKDEAKAAEIEQALKSLMQEKGYDDSRLEREFDQLNALYRQTIQWNKQASTLLLPFKNAHEDTVDQFCVTANALRAQGDLRGVTFRAIESFFADENARIKKLADAVIDKSDLAERDRAMNRNALNYFQTSGKKSVAMIVGYAHLESAAEALKAAGVSFIAGTLPSVNDDLEPWEAPAWEKRHDPIQSIFSSSSNKDQTRFQDPKWKPEEAAKLSYFQNLPGVSSIPPGSAKYFDRLGGNPNRSVRVGEILVDRNADIGEHVLEQGVVPGTRSYYQVYDRKVASDLVRKLSDSGTVFSYFFKTNRGGRAPSYEFSVPRGTENLAQFNAVPPGKPGRPPKRVVLFGEPDDVKEGDTPVSPLWKALRAGGGGAGDPPNRGWTTTFADPEPNSEGDRQGTELLRTINARRAKEKLIAVDRQDPIKFNQIQFVEDGNMEKLWFTPRAGDRSQVVVFLGRNDPAFRENVRRAALEGKLKNKQIALITCGDAYAETAALRELLLREGALMVWVPDRQITPEAGMHLKNEIATSFSEPRAKRPRTIQGIVERSLSNWRSRAPNDPDLKSFEQSGSWVFVFVSRAGMAS